MMAPVSYLAPVLFSLLSLPSVSSLSFNYNFSQPGSFNPADLNLFSTNSTLLNSKERPDAPNMDRISPSIGRVLYAQPVPLWDDATGEVASFSMSVTFCLRIYQSSSTSRNCTDARMAFFLRPYQPAVPPPLSYGSSHSNHNETTGKDQIMEVEFDAYLQKLDNGLNHMISVDVHYIVSKVQLNTTFPGETKNLSAGCTMMIAQIDYDTDKKRLDTGLRIGDVSHHINTSVDLMKSLPKEVAIGFFSTTGQPIELHNVLCWSFNSTLGRKNSSVMPLEMEPEVAESPMVPWKKFLIRLDPWNWSVELNLQVQFHRIWDRINLVLNSTLNVSLVYGIQNWN